MLKKICPCISWFSSGQSSQLPRKTGYQPQSEFEEEEFMHQLDTEAKKAKESNHIMSQEIPIQQQLEKVLNVNEKPKIQNENVAPARKKSDKNATTPLIETNNEELKPQQPTGIKSSQQIEKSYDFNNLGQLQVNIPQYGPNYQLLKQKAHNVAELLDTTKNCTQVPLNIGKTQQQSKLNINKSQLRVWKTENANCYIIQYQIPCSYSYFNEMANKKIQPKDNNKLIRQYRLVESIHQNLTLRYICFNKIGMLQPRDFTYLKYTNMSTTNPSGHWQLCISKDAQKQANNTIKSGKLFSVSYIIEENKVNVQPDERKGIKIRVRTYINLEINVTVEKVWQRILKQTKEYIEDMWEQAQSNYSQELV